MGVVSIWWLLVGIAAGLVFGLFFGWIRGLQMAGEAFAHRAVTVGAGADLDRLLKKIEESECPGTAFCTHGPITTCGTTKTPPGYRCTRELGHEGPCAAKPYFGDGRL